MTVTTIIPSWTDIIEGYKEGDAHLSYSSLKAFAESPRHFMRYKTEKRTSKAMDWGNLMHTLALEPETFEERYYTIPPDAPKKPTSAQLKAKKPSDKTLTQIEWWENFLSDKHGKEEVKFDDKTLAERAVKALHSNKGCSFLFERIDEAEYKINWEYKGFKWKGAIDIILGAGFGYCDLKTIANAHPKKCTWEIFDRKYHWQAYLYTRSRGVKTPYYIVFIDKQLNITTIQLKESTILAAGEEINETIAKFKKCLFFNEWDKSYDFHRKNGLYEV